MKLKLSPPNKSVECFYLQYPSAAEGDRKLFGTCSFERQNTSSSNSEEVLMSSSSSSSNSDVELFELVLVPALAWVSRDPS